MLCYLTVYVKQTDLWSQPPKLRGVEKASETKRDKADGCEAQMML